MTIELWSRIHQLYIPSCIQKFAPSPCYIWITYEIIFHVKMKHRNVSIFCFLRITWRWLYLYIRCLSFEIYYFERIIIIFIWYLSIKSRFNKCLLIVLQIPASYFVRIILTCNKVIIIAEVENQNKSVIWYQVLETAFQFYFLSSWFWSGKYLKSFSSPFHKIPKYIPVFW